MADRTPATTSQKPEGDNTATAEAPASCTKTVEPNKMVFYNPTSGKRHEIYIPRGKFQKAHDLYVQKNWEELCKFLLTLARGMRSGISGVMGVVPRFRRRRCLGSSVQEWAMSTGQSTLYLLVLIIPKHKFALIAHSP